VPFNGARLGEGGKWGWRGVMGPVRGGGGQALGGAALAGSVTNSVTDLDGL